MSEGEELRRDNEELRTANQALRRKVEELGRSDGGRRQAEGELRESEERFRAVANLVPDLLYRTDPEGRLVWCNQRWLDYTGKTLAEALGYGWVDAVYEEDRERVKQAYRDVLKSGGSFRSEHRLVGSDGRVRWFLARAEPTRHADGRIMQWFGAKTDIEDYKRTRQQLETALRETERARAEGEAASQAKDHFLAVLSHELRTPLTPVIMGVKMLKRRRDLPDPAHEALAMIERNVQIEAHLIDDLLDLTRISHGKLEIVPEPVDVHAVVRQAAEISAEDMEGKGQTFTVALDADEHRVQGDARRLQQVFWNLLKNASKFTPKGGAVRIGTRNAPGRVIVEVADTGIGFEDGVAERIFDAFAQASVDITRQFGGLGLGLAIAKATVDAHDGRLSAQSGGANRGATFSVELPLADDGRGENIA